MKSSMVRRERLLCGRFDCNDIVQLLKLFAPIVGIY